MYNNWYNFPFEKNQEFWIVILSICFYATCISWINSVGKLSLIGHPCYHVHCTLYSCKSPNMEFNVLIYDSRKIPCPKTGAANTLYILYGKGDAIQRTE